MRIRCSTCQFSHSHLPRSIGGGSLFRAGAAPCVLIALLLQVVFGMTAFASGIVTFASAAGAMSMKVTARPILKRFGFRTVMIANGSSASNDCHVCILHRRDTRAAYFCAVLVGGSSMLQYTATQAIAYATFAPADEHRKQCRQHGAAAQPRFGIAFWRCVASLAAWRVPPILHFRPAGRVRGARRWPCSPLCSFGHGACRCV